MFIDDFVIFRYFNLLVKVLLCYGFWGYREMLLVGVRMCVFRGKMIGVKVLFLEEKKKNEKDGDFYFFYFWVEKLRLDFFF